MFKYETHLHTDETSPCGRVPAAEAVRIYRNAGYTGIVVTDHYSRGFFERLLFKNWETKIDLYLAGYRKALDEGARSGLDVHLGMEIQFNENPNDYLVYGFDEQLLRAHKKLYRLGLENFRKLTAGSGVVIIQAHPFRPRMIPANPALIDGIEIYNGNPRHDSSNHLALEYARENGLKMLSGSDFHQVQDAARGGIIVDERVKPGGFARMIMENGNIECIRT
ncbi:MAG TPA: PHP domain-containing protein [Clostridia bacterium]|nr:PHP domain-containing protein [Clostridia bacterium]